MSKRGSVLRVDFSSIAENISDAALAELGACSKIRALNMSGMTISKKVFAAILSLEQLSTLNLENTNLNDLQFEQLAKLPHLKIVCIRGSQTTADQVAQLRKRMINLRIIY